MGAYQLIAVSPRDCHEWLAVKGDGHTGVAAVGVDVVVKRALMYHVIALEFLDGDEEFFPRGGVKVVMVTEDLAAHFLTNHVSILVDEGALLALLLRDDELGELTFLVKREVLAAAVVALD